MFADLGLPNPEEALHSTLQLFGPEGLEIFALGGVI